MHQALVRKYLLDTQPDWSFQIAVLEEAMSNFYRYLFIMPTLARLELEMHERVEKGDALTASYLNGRTAELIGEVYGDEVDMSGEDRDRVGSTWAQFHTHLYSNFYVYQYATGIAGAHHLVRAVAAGDRKAAESYLAFLKSGGSVGPLEGLRLRGGAVQSPAPARAAFEIAAGRAARRG